jgi:hypothetical protein
MPMADSYLNLTATAGGAAITHIGLVNGSGTEVTGGSPAYARKPVTWTTPTSPAGLIRPTTDLVFDIPAAGVVAGWRGFTALTGGTNHGGASMTSETFAGQGTFTLLAASTAIDHDAV